MKRRKPHGSGEPLIYSVKHALDPSKGGPALRQKTGTQNLFFDPNHSLPVPSYMRISESLKMVHRQYWEHAVGDIIFRANAKSPQKKKIGSPGSKGTPKQGSAQKATPRPPSVARSSGGSRASVRRNLSDAPPARALKPVVEDPGERPPLVQPTLVTDTPLHSRRPSNVHELVMSNGSLPGKGSKETATPPSSARRVRMAEEEDLEGSRSNSRVSPRPGSRGLNRSPSLPRLVATPIRARLKQRVPMKPEVKKWQPPAVTVIKTAEAERLFRTQEHSTFYDDEYTSDASRTLQACDEEFMPRVKYRRLGRKFAHNQMVITRDTPVATDVYEGMLAGAVTGAFNVSRHARFIAPNVHRIGRSDLEDIPDELPEPEMVDDTLPEFRGTFGVEGTAYGQIGMTKDANGLFAVSVFEHYSDVPYGFPLPPDWALRQREREDPRQAPQRNFIARPPTPNSDIGWNRLLYEGPIPETE